jgi:hypothetical protein
LKSKIKYALQSQRAVDIILVQKIERNSQPKPQNEIYCINLKASDTVRKTELLSLVYLTTSRRVVHCSASSIPAAGFLFFNTGVIPES